MKDPLRPESLKDYVGQKRVKEQINICIQGTKSRGEMLPHILLFSAPGLGKTLLAEIIAREMGYDFIHLIGTAISSPAQLAQLLVGLNETGKPTCIFIDEGHRLKANVEEALYAAMENWRVTILVKPEGKKEKIPIEVPIPKFTLMMATNYIGCISPPLLNRFQLTLRFQPYNDTDMKALIMATAKRLRTKLDPDACAEIIKRSRGTPRTANHYLQRARDVSVVNKHSPRITLKDVEKTFDLLEIDDEGMCEMDRKYIEVLRRAGRPLSVKTIGKSIGEPVSTLEQVIEPFLISRGLIVITNRGRCVL